MSDDDHGIDVEEDTDDEDEEVPAGADPPEPAPPEEKYDERAAEAREQENVDNHRDEEPFESD